MNRIRKRLRTNIVLFTSILGILCALALCSFLIHSFKTLSAEEEVQFLAQLNHQVASTLPRMAPDCSHETQKEHYGRVLKILSSIKTLSYTAITGIGEGTAPCILYDREGTLQRSPLPYNPSQQTEVERRAGILQVSSPINGCDPKEPATTVAFLVSGFSDSSSEAAVRTITILIVGLGVVAILTVCSMGIIQSRLACAPLKNALTMFEHVAEGDCLQHGALPFHDELKELFEAFTAYMTTWRCSIEKIKHTVALFSSASHAISLAAHQHDVFTVKEETSISKITASIDTLRTASQKIGENAEHVSERSQAALAILSDGTEAISKSAQEFNAMGNEVKGIATHVHTLHNGALRIQSITEAITTIAHKTEMLAINAGIEAAKVQGNGQGYSVIASEIRNVADQIQQSASHIILLIHKIQTSADVTMGVTDKGTKSAERGIAFIEETGEIFTRVLTAMDAIVNELKEIVRTAQHQSLGIGKIADIMTGVNECMRETVTAAHNMCQASLQLHVLSRELNEAVSCCKI